jgi:gliding motility-associated lipoprotein GldH
MFNKKTIFYFILFYFILSACDNNTYKNYYSFENGIWNTDSVVNFTFTVNDTTKYYDISLKIRHTVYYEYQNLFLFLDNLRQDTVEIMLAEKSGKWLGNGINDIREFEFLLEQKKQFFELKKYTLSVEQAMRYGAFEKLEDLNHILDLGIIVKEHHE